MSYHHTIATADNIHLLHLCRAEANYREVKAFVESKGYVCSPLLEVTEDLYRMMITAEIQGIICDFDGEWNFITYSDIDLS